MKIIKRILALIVISGLLLNTACFNDKKENKSSKLVINVMEYDNYLRNAIKTFNSNHTDCKIEEKLYYNDQYEKYSEDIQAGLLSNDGADIIVTSPIRIPMLSKYIEKGSFSELDDLYNDDKSINKDDYYGEIMNYGIYKGKRYLIPLSYTIDALFTTKSILDEKGIDNLSQDIGWKDISKLSEDYQKKQGGKSYLLPYLSFNSVLKGLDSTTIDIDNKTSSLASDDAKNALKFYKSINKSVMPASELSKKASNGDLSALLNNGDSIFLNAAISGPQMLWYNYLSFKSEIQPMVYSVKNSNNKVPAKVDLFAAISSKCTNKEAAYKFISMLLSRDSQTKTELYGIPVCKTAYQEKKDMCIKGQEDSSGGQVGRKGGLKTEDSIKMLLTQIDEIIANIDVCKIEDNQIYSLIDNKVLESLLKNDTDEIILKSLQEEVDEYFKKGLESTAQKKENTQAVDTSVKAKISISYLGYQQHVKNALRKCKEIYPNIDIAETVYDNNNFQDMITKLSTELMAGAGPDIVLFYDYYFNISKVTDSGVFTDLNSLINADKEFNKDDYFQRIFDAGIYNNKRLFIPLRYSIPYFTTTNSTLKENNINIDKSGFSLESLSELAKSFAENKHKAKNLIDYSFQFIDMMYSSGIDFVDYKNKKSNFNSQEFIELLKEYKDIFSSKATFEERVKFNTCVEMTKDNQLVFGFDTSNEFPQVLRSTNSRYKSVIGEEMEIIPIINNGVCNASLNQFVAINSNCKNMEAAFKLIKIMLSKDIQKATDSYGSNNYNLFLPINKQAYTEDMKFYMENEDTTAFGLEFPLVKLPVGINDKMNNLIEKMQPANSLDIDIIRIVNKELDNYIKGKASAEQTAKAIDDKVMLFLNE